jgi:HEAT repeat protein
MLRAHDSPLKTKLLRWASRYAYFRSAVELNLEADSGFAALGGDAASAVPELTKIVDDSPNDGRAAFPIMILLRLGPAAHDAVPSLLRAATSTDQSTRALALEALGRIHASPEAVVPVLRSALHDPSAVNRANAAGGLESFQSYAKPAVPDLVAILREPDGGSNSVSVLPWASTISVRSRAEDALQQIDPGTYARVVTNASPR